MNETAPLSKKSYSIDPKDPINHLKNFLQKHDENFGKV
jgi:hypothetical protein